MALRLSRAVDTSAELWMNLQKNYDLWLAENETKEWQNVQPLFFDKLHANIQDSAKNPINQTRLKNVRLVIGVRSMIAQEFFNT